MTSGWVAGRPIAGPSTGAVPVVSVRRPTLPIKWEYLISFRPTHSVQRSLKWRYTLDWDVHRLEDAYGDINLDYYPIMVSRLPSVGGRAVTAEEFLNLIRLNINKFVDTSIAEFAPYDSSHASRWRSATPLGAVIHIDMKLWGGRVNPDDGSVVVGEFTPQYWIFSTIWTPADFAHPVSGNRQFGFTRQDNGSYIFFTRAADRTTRLVDWAISKRAFRAGDRLWRSFQQWIAYYGNGNGGSASVKPAMSNRYDWPAVKARYHHPTITWL